MSEDLQKQYKLKYVIYEVLDPIRENEVERPPSPKTSQTVDNYIKDDRDSSKKYLPLTHRDLNNVNSHIDRERIVEYRDELIELDRIPELLYGPSYYDTHPSFKYEREKVFQKVSTAAIRPPKFQMNL